MGEEAEAGGLISYGASVNDLFRRAAVYVDKFDLVINVKTLSGQDGQDAKRARHRQRQPRFKS